jgi:putative transposase
LNGREISRMRANRTPPRHPLHDYTSRTTVFVTFNLLNRARDFKDERLAAIATSVIRKYRELGWYQLRAYCIMPDHVHLLIAPLGASRTISRIVATIKNQVVYRCKSLDVRLLWQWGYYDRFVRSYEDGADYVRYVLMNPVRQGLVREAHQYPWSGVLDPI